MALEAPMAVLDILKRLPILSREQLAELEQQHVVTHPNASELVKTMIRLRWITVYQAKKIMGGRADDLVIGHYVVQDKLGEGGMGRVFRAVQLNLNRVVALKVVRASLLKNEVALRRFKREVKAAAALSHPNIVRVFDADQAGERHFLAMENIEGSDLGRLVRDHGQLPIAVACSFVRQAALGLQHAHDLGFVHRDIKPSNLLVAVNDKGQYGPKNTVKILDMGLAREQHVDPNAAGISTELTRTGTVVGTPDYMSPEQAKNSSNVDHRSDLYALGCTFFYLLTGEVVFPNGNPLEKLLSHQMDAPRPIQLIRMDTPSEVASIIQCLLAKRPEQRFQSGAALAHALEPWCTGKGTALQPAVVLQAEAVDPITELDLPKPGSPFDFADLDDDETDEPTRVTTAQPPALPTRDVNAAPTKKWLMLLIPLAILAIGLSIGGVLGFRQWKDRQADSQLPPEAPKGETPKADTPKTKVEPKPVPTKDLDSLEKYLPNDTAVLVVLEPKAFQSSTQVKERLVHPLNEALKNFKNATSIDLPNTVDRMIVSYPEVEKNGILVILQGKTLVTERAIDGLRNLKSVRTEKLPDKSELFILPWQEDEQSLFVAATDTSVLITLNKQRLLEALEKRDGAKRTTINDPTIEAAIRMMYSRVLYPHAIFAAIGLRSGLMRFVPPAGRLNFACAAVSFEERMMHFYTVVDEKEAGKAVEFQRLLAKFLMGKLNDDSPANPRLEKLGELLQRATLAPASKGKFFHSHTRIPYDQLADWFGPFLPFPLED